ncbi:MAG: hypothetical protein LLG06_07615 [Desulfobacteraceae bacterium]|nr:hypothetical protein [Desulfobacteraceae bacterium]
MQTPSNCIEPPAGKTPLRMLIAAACLALLVATAGMLARYEPFYSGYYSFAWWSFIVIVQAYLRLRGGRSLLFENPLRFLLLLPLSVTVWLVFEAANFRLSNWHYINVPSLQPFRWIGYSISYATVLPGIFSVGALLDHFGVFKNSQSSIKPDPERLYVPFFILGFFSLILPLIWPKYFFPLIWGAFIFLLEPINHRFGAPSLLRKWREGSLRTFYLLMLSGAVCGFIWELWNFKAGTKWVYTVPFVGGFKVFEMPLLGFMGFPPFAVECYAMSATFFLIVRQIGEKYSLRGASASYAAFTLAIVLFDMLVFSGIDRFTILSFRDIHPFAFFARP